MIGDTMGYVLLKSTADCKFAMGDDKDWQDKILTAHEINEDTKSVLLINSKGTGLGMFSFDDIKLKFHCEEYSGIIIPKGLDFVAKAAYAMSRMSRKGGYNKDVKYMVIAASLEKQELYDDFLNNNINY